MKNAIVFSQNRYFELPAEDLQVFQKDCMDVLTQLKVNDASSILQDILNEITHSSGSIKNVNGLQFFWLEGHEQSFYVGDKNRILVANQNADIMINGTDSILAINQNRTLEVYSGSVYINGSLINDGLVVLEYGDCILIGMVKLMIHKDYITIGGSESAYYTSLCPYISPEQRSEEYPLYKRSPRIIKHIPSEDVTLINPPAKEKHKKGQLAKVIAPPIVMLAITIVISILTPRGIYILMSIAATLMSLIFSITTFINDRKEMTAKEQNRLEAYDDYLLRLRKRLYKLYEEHKEALTYHYPNLQSISAMIEKHSSRIYERNINDDDFLTLSIGFGDIHSGYKLKIPEDAVTIEKDPLSEELADVCMEFKTIKDMPITVDLKKAHLGIVGEKSFIHEQLKLLLAQITFEQSYHDAEIVFLLDHEERSHFSWAKWYPHLKIKNINITGIVDSENIRDQVLGNISQVLKQRKQKKQEQKMEGLFAPYYIFIIDNPQLIINHSIMEYLQGDISLGFSIIYTTNMQANLPEYIKTILVLNDSETGTLLMKEGELYNQKLRLYHTREVNLEKMSRGLAPRVHIKGVSTQIPESITFFDMYQIKTPQELRVVQRWNMNSSHKTLAVPLGVRAQNDYVYLNLHEKAHGPHGLVAGTTGSGKSEIIQSYILSLAVNFHPYEVGFLLIDYKGGGMASLFKRLPHLLGTITNLDGCESMRAMASIKSELSRRQRIFNQYRINHINQYNKLFKEGNADKPLPHLFLISDEFAELKKEQPEFMSELVSAARIGRSLGIHLILATQKPTGVVDDQIWSNSKFKLALKVQDASDSNEILKTPDAANITLPGRAYLQVGNNEIYELFQSAWSGADYSREKEKNDVDDRVYTINNLGQKQLINKDLSEEAGNEAKVTQLDAVVDYISEEYQTLRTVTVDKPWLPSLDTNLVTPYISEIINVGLLEEIDASAILGLVDIPEQQLQKEYVHNFISDGNLAVFGSSGFGKSTTLMTLALSLAVKNAPKRVQFFVVDLGSSSLAQLRGLPHTADYFTFDDSEKLKKLSKKLTDEIKRRKAAFANANVINLSMYNSSEKEKLPVIVVVIDNFDIVKELGIDFEEFLTKLTRDGIGVGIYTAITATRANAVKYAVLNNFKNKLVHYMFDNTEVVSLIGRTPYTLKEIKGRALIKLTDIHTMQVYCAVESKDDYEYVNRIGLLISRINEKYTGARIEGIRMLPDILTLQLLRKYVSAKVETGKIAVGLDTEDVAVQYIHLDSPLYLIIGSVQSGKTNLLKLIVSMTTGCKKIYLLDSKDMELATYKSEPHVQYISDSKGYADFFKNLAKETENRRSDFLNSKDTSITPKMFYNGLSKILVVIDDADNFIELAKAEKITAPELILQDAISVGITFIATTLNSRLKGYDGVTKLFKESVNGIILGLPTEQTIWSLPHMRDYKASIDKGILYKKGELKQIKIPCTN